MSKFVMVLAAVAAVSGRADVTGFRMEPGDRHVRIVTWWPDRSPLIAAAQETIARELKRVTGVAAEIPTYANTPMAGDIYVSTQPWDAPGAWRMKLEHGVIEIHGADDQATLAAAKAFVAEFLAKEPTGRGWWEIADFVRTHGPQYEDVKAAAIARVAAARAAENAPEWENELVTEVNRAPARAYSFPLASVEAALADEPASPWVKSLNGRWRYRWTGRPADRPKDFYRTDFDDAEWNEIDVPSCVETKGFGLSIYTNKRYPHPVTPPKLDPDYNPVSSYRTTFTVPDDWNGREVYIRFDGVLSGFYLWVNGQKVGYSEDSFLPAEFNITQYLRDFRREAGDAKGECENVLAVEAYRWTDGSYLEDQDCFRFSGIFRDVTLWSMPKDGVWDFRVKAEASGRIEVKVWGKAEGGSGVPAACQEGKHPSLTSGEDAASPLGTRVALFDGDGKMVGGLTPSSDSIFSLHLDRPRLWSAEDPYLYTLVICRGDDIRSCKVGFRSVEIAPNGAVLFNGRPIKFKGVNRHEASPVGGRTLTHAEMERDVDLMKKYNVDMVRTAHYPPDPYFVRLCERHGLYLMPDGNVESHGLGYGTNSLALYPSWEKAHVERNARMVANYRNSPAVFMWSLGNEAGMGPNFDAATAAVRALDPTIPVIYRHDCGKLPIDADTYVTLARTRERGLYPKCFFHIEYCHAMGNALGHLGEYWDEYYRSPSLIGGAIWDWVDQAVWKTTDRVGPDGRPLRYLAYGGDFDEEPNDGNFCANGVLDAERHVTPKLIEVGHVHRNLIVRKKGGALTLENRYGFTNANAFDGDWELVVDGAVVRRGAFAVPDVAPLTTGALAWPEIGQVPTGEAFLNVAFRLKRDTGWAKRGWPVARNQVKIGGTFRRREATGGGTVETRDDGTNLTVRAGRTEAVFSRTSGTLAKLVMNGKTVLADAAGIVRGPRLTCARAFTDNDGWLRTRTSRSPADLPTFYESGLTQLRYHPVRFAVEKGADRVTVDVKMRVDGAKSAGWEHAARWVVTGDGRMSVENRIVPHGMMPILPRIGTTWMLDPRLERVEWYGRGPHENYLGRNASAFVGRYASTVTDEYVPYIRPQENGGKSDVRWIALTDEAGDGVRFTFAEPGFAQALHYGWEDLEFARHRAGQQRIWHPLVPRAETFLNLDVGETGIGEGSCGEIPLEKYRLKAREMSWRIDVEPFHSGRGEEPGVSRFLSD